MLPSVPDELIAVELVRAAHRICPYSNAFRGEAVVGLVANGRTIEE